MERETGMISNVKTRFASLSFDTLCARITINLFKSNLGSPWPTPPLPLFPVMDTAKSGSNKLWDTVLFEQKHTRLHREFLRSLFFPK